MLLCAACATTREYNAVDQLMEHPQFGAAANAAPDWSRSVLRQLAEYEYELERR